MFFRIFKQKSGKCFSIFFLKRCRIFVRERTRRLEVTQMRLEQPNPRNSFYWTALTTHLHERPPSDTRFARPPTSWSKHASGWPKLYWSSKRQGNPWIWTEILKIAKTPLRTFLERLRVPSRLGGWFWGCWECQACFSRKNENFVSAPSVVCHKW